MLISWLSFVASEVTVSAVFWIELFLVNANNNSCNWLFWSIGDGSRVDGDNDTVDDDDIVDWFDDFCGLGPCQRRCDAKFAGHENTWKIKNYNQFEILTVLLYV